MLRSLGLLGYGRFGAFLHEVAEAHAPGLVVRAADPAHPPDGELFVREAELADCDAVVLAVPLSAYEGALRRLAPRLRADAVLVDVASAKQHTVALLREHAAGRPYLATHPMFGPESWRRRGGRLQGLRLVVCESTLAPTDRAALGAALAALGLDVIEMDAAQHDRDVAETLFLTHFVGQVVAHAGFERTRIDTVSFGSLMDAVDSVRDDRALFAEVFRHVPHCREVIERFGRSDAHVREAILGLGRAED